MKGFLDSTKYQNNPLRILNDFLQQEDSYKKGKLYDKMRFVGYPIKIGYNEVSIITSDPYKIAVGGIPRNSLLIMIPQDSEKFPPHFTLLRVLEATPTPLDSEVQQTYFELQKKSMPELDVFTQSELQWGSFKASVLGMFYPHPDNDKTKNVEFSGDINNFVSPHKYMIYSPSDEILDLIINSMVPESNRFEIGNLRLTECRLKLNENGNCEVPVLVSTIDFMGTRTAMFGKTRLGKSNVVKLIAESLIESSRKEKNIGQLIFDINGEYANDNPQDDNFSLASAYPKDCFVYALTKKDETESKPLKLNFYMHPESSHKIIAKLLEISGRAGSNYVKSFINVDVPSFDFLLNNPEIEKNVFNRAQRKILMFWAILNKAGFVVNESDLINNIIKKFTSKVSGKPKFRFSINPGYKKELREEIYGNSPPPNITNLQQLTREFEKLATLLRKTAPDNPLICSSNGNPLFESDERAMLEFLNPSSGTGPGYIIPYRSYHDKEADEFINEILDLLEKSKTVILDLGNAHPELMSFYSDQLSREIFMNQVDKFSNNRLGNKYIQLYFEEAHNLFPSNQDASDIYLRIAKEGAKYHIGMVYSTQSVSTINRDLLAQTENFFIAHLSSQNEVDALARVNIAYESLKEDILRAKTVGYVRILTRSHRFAIPVQARKFSPKTKET